MPSDCDAISSHSLYFCSPCLIENWEKRWVFISRPENPDLHWHLWNFWINERFLYSTSQGAPFSWWESLSSKLIPSLWKVKLPSCCSLSLISSFSLLRFDWLHHFLCPSAILILAGDILHRNHPWGKTVSSTSGYSSPGSLLLDGRFLPIYGCKDVPGSTSASWRIWETGK